jgi:structural maintenance of chromosome 4
VAVSTACGQLESIVVETTKQAEQCIEFLRANKIGRANFVILERIAENCGSQMQ